MLIPLLPPPLLLLLLLPCYLAIPTTYSAVAPRLDIAVAGSQGSVRFVALDRWGDDADDDDDDDDDDDEINLIPYINPTNLSS